MDQRKSKYPSVVILAAGRGTRISRFTKIPKSLLKIENEKTILETNIEKFIRLGVKKIIVVVGYKKKLFISILKKYKKKIKIDVIHNKFYISKGNSYSLLLGLQRSDSSSTFIDGDIMIDFSILKNFFKFKKENIALVGKGHINDLECAKVFINKKKKIKYMIDKKLAGKKILRDHSFLGEAVGIINLTNKAKEKFIFILKKFLKERKNYQKNWEKPLNVFIEKNDLNFYFTKSNKWIEIDNKSDFLAAKLKFNV